MSRSRQVVFASLGVVAAGVAVAMGAMAFGPTHGIGPLPAEALALPGDTSFLVGLDVKRLTATALYKKQMATASLTRPDAFKELEEKTGLNPERDVDQVVIAGGKAGSVGGLALVLGRFDEYKVSRAIETKKGVTWDKHEGTTVYTFAEGSKDTRALAFFDATALLVGETARVKAAIENKSRGSAAVRSNPTLVALLERVKPGSTFWMVGDQTLLAALPATLPSPGGAQGSSLSLPALKSLIVTGDLEPMIALSITGDTADEAAAKNLADVVRGFVALASLQAGQKPELQQLASAFSVTTTANQVDVSFRIAPEALEALMPKPAPRTPPAPSAVQ